MNPLDYDYLRKLLREQSGLVLAPDKQYLAESRLLPLVRKYAMAGLGDLIARVKAAPHSAIAIAVVEAMTTNETFFFRDKMPFDHFKDFVLPRLLMARAKERKLRIWCNACSTGQEPYSLAMILDEKRLDDWKIDIVATDISNDVLARAKAGLYSQFEVQRGLPIQLLVKYFTQVREQWQIAPHLRTLVSFKNFNLLNDFAPLGQFDVVFCRNVLIYFDQDNKSAVLNRLARALAPDGYLVLGAAETVVGLTDVFKPMADHRGLYVAHAGKAGKPALAAVRSPPLAPAMTDTVRVAAAKS
ncbi:MAG: protein-glutamate O-methyltransferase [Pseudolabrys sp.]|nr:protein-glutamate O-methyltransferase [Pseudolabrys sp.]